MFVIDSDKTIHITRGDIATIEIGTKDKSTGEDYVFKSGDVVRLNVHTKNKPADVVLLKDVKVQEGGTTVMDMFLDMEDTKIGDIIKRPKDYWYEIELNPDTAPQTIIGYDKETGAKIFRLYPEGGDKNEY